MNAISCQGTTTNHEILAIADRIFAITRLSIQRAAGVVGNDPTMTLPTDSGRRVHPSIERSARDFLLSYQTLNSSAVSRLADASPTAGGSGMMLTRASSPSMRLAMTLDFASQGSVLAQAQADNYFAGLRLSPASVANLRWNRTTNDVAVPMDKQAYTRQILDAVAPRRIDGTASVSVGASSAPPTQRVARELRLKLDSLTAVHRFGWELSDWGNDDISCGGDGLDATLPQPKHIKRSAFDVHSFTRDGEIYNMSPDRIFVKFDLSRPGQWPRSYIANVFIAEKDASGGFIEFLQKLWDAIGPQVISLSTTLILGALGYAAGTGAAAAGTGAAAGAAAGSVAPLVGTIVGAIVGAVLGLLVAWLLDSLRDDIFESPDNPLAVILPDPTALFENNSLKSPKYIADFERGAARYLLRYYWELSY